MTFASPLWLIGLLPWLGVALYLLWGRRKRRDVPFLELWHGPAAVEHAKWKVSAPPIALAMALLAMLAAVLGAARPGARWGAGSSQTAVAVVVDRGLTMSAIGTKDLGFREAGREAASEIAAVFGPGAPIDAWIVPARQAPADGAGNADRFGSPGAWSQSLDRLPATAIDSTEAVRVTVRRALSAGTGPVVVISDAAIGIEDSRVVHVTPQTPVRNAGIALLSAREMPRPQVMVRVRNDLPGMSAALEVNFGDGGDAPVRKAIDLPPTGGERDFFLNAKRLGQIVSATLIVSDDLTADNKAWLVRESAWPRVELIRAAGGLSRLVKVYTKLHPPGDGARVVRVVSQIDDLGAEESGVVIDPGSADSGGAVRPTHVEPHPITDAVKNWESLNLPAGPVRQAHDDAVRQAHDGDGKPPADFLPLLSAGERTLVAVRDVSATVRHVWVGLSPAGWADRPEYVAFWAAAFDWAGGVGSGGARYASYPLERFDASWKPADAASHDPGTWPGLYRRADDALRAFNAAPPRLAPPTANPSWRQDLTRLRSTGTGYRDLSAVPMLASAAFILLAAATWRKAR